MMALESYLVILFYNDLIFIKNYNTVIITKLSQGDKRSTSQVREEGNRLCTVRKSG